MERHDPLETVIAYLPISIALDEKRGRLPVGVERNHQLRRRSVHLRRHRHARSRSNTDQWCVALQRAHADWGRAQVAHSERRCGVGHENCVQRAIGRLDDAVAQCLPITGKFFGNRGTGRFLRAQQPFAPAGTVVQRDGQVKAKAKAVELASRVRF